VAIILSPFDSGTLSFVMMHWNIVTTIMNMFIDELFALGAWTDWHGPSSRVGVHCRCMLVQLRVAEAPAVTMFCSIAPLRRIVLRVVWLQENTLPLVVLEALCDFLFRISSFSMPAASIVWREEVLGHPQSCGWSLLVLMLYCFFPGIPSAGARPYTIQNREVTYS
jgi:hypothetical protein